MACCVSVAAARGSQPAERRHPDLHGDRPLHVHVAADTIPQARQQKGKADDTRNGISYARSEVWTRLILTAITETALISIVRPTLKEYCFLNCSTALDV
jgi:hypothetical protein